jgi:hypothetical protein
VRFYTPRRAGVSRGAWGVRLLVPVLCVLAGMLGVAAPAFAGLTHVNESSFGEEGSGAGQLNRATGVAVNDATGDVYVLDAGNKRVEQFTATGSFVREFAPTGGFEPFTAPGAIAVDDSANPLDVSKEDVYVTDPAAETIDKFEADGHFLSAIHEAAAGKTLTGLVGIAVDGEGHVWASYGCNQLSEFSDTQPNGFVVTQEATTGGCLGAGLGVDSEGDLWAIQGSGFGAKLSPTGEVLNPPGQEVGGEGHHGLAVDPTTNSVYLASASNIVEYSSAGGEVETFGAGNLSGVEAESEPVAIDPATGTVYVADVSADAIRVFPYVILPVAASTPATGLGQEGDATLNATVNPEGVELTECKFEYGTSTSYGETVPCTQTPGQIGSGTNPIPVTANLTGLTVPSEYHYRLAAVNTNGEVAGPDETFTAPAKPAIEAPEVSSVTASEAIVTAQINPGGLASSLHVDYGPTEAYGSSTPDVSLGAGTSQAGVRVELRGLSPSTSYHSRIVVDNSLGSTEQSLASFSTSAQAETASETLPDDRAYELVSPASNPGEVYVPTVRLEREEVFTLRPDRAATDGEAVTYVGDPPASGGSGAQGDGAGDQFIARREPSGWVATDISPNLPITIEPPFEAFSDDLSASVFHEESGAAPPSGESAPAGCPEALYGYEQASSTFTPLFTTTLTPGSCGEPRFAGASESWSEVFFQDEAPLVAGTTLHEFEYGGKPACLAGCNLYDATSGVLRVVNVLPDGSSTVGATFGGVTPRRNPENEGLARKVLGNVIAASGDRAVWTDTEAGVDQGHIFVRMNPGSVQSTVSEGHCTEPANACTLQVSVGSARYMTATPNGRYVFYLEAGGLWRYDTDTAERDAIAANASGALGVVGVSDDGESVYFVAEAALTGTANPVGEIAEETGCSSRHAEGCNLYMWHAGVITFVGALSGLDNEAPGRYGGGAPLASGDWAENAAQHTAFVTSDGEHVVFQSVRGFGDANNLGETERGAQRFSEIYMYNAGPTPSLVCVSCRPDGAAPAEHPGGGPEGNTFGTYLPAGPTELTAPRWASDDGSRVFFNSNQPLVADEPGKEPGVYQWEREGAGSCTVTMPPRHDYGCISLLSGTGSTYPSTFLEADPSGDNVFIASRKQLTSQGTGERMMVYDVRVGGGFSTTSLACTGTGCQGVPPTAPSFATPPSATFSGGGNFTPQPTAPAKPLSAAQRLARALKACRRDRRHATRLRCERKAREAHRHAALHAARKSTKKGPHHA